MDKNQLSLEIKADDTFTHTNQGNYFIMYLS